MSVQAHPTAFIDPRAELGVNVRVGAFAVIEAGAKVGDGSEVGHHAVIHSGSSLGAKNQVFAHAVVGGAPQDLKYAGQPTRLEIGDSNLIREFTTLNRGTEEGGGVTRIGSHNLFMAYCHIAHDSLVGDHVVVANSVAIAGHGQIGDHVVIGGLSGLHQYGRIGTGAMVGGMARLSKDVAPFSITSGTEEVKVYGLNKIGLKRRGMPKAELSALEVAYRIFQDPKLNTSEALAQLEALTDPVPSVQVLIQFMRSSDRGIYR